MTARARTQTAQCPPHHFIVKGCGQVQEGVCKFCNAVRFFKPYAAADDAAFTRQARAIQARRKTGSGTHCPYGHEFTPENTYTSPAGVRQCKECRRMNQRRADAMGRRRRVPK